MPTPEQQFYAVLEETSLIKELIKEENKNISTRFNTLEALIADIHIKIVDQGK